jgi:uncharacterized protein DUF4397
MNRHRPLAALLCAVALASCGKDSLQDITGTPPGANIRFINFGVGAPGVNFFANDTKLTAIGSTTGSEATTGTVYGAGGNAGFYSGIAPGQYTLSGRIAAATDKNLAIASVPATLEDGKSYTFYLSGFYNSTAKTVDAFVIEDPFSQQIDFTTAYVRFVNAISNSSPMTLYAKNQTTKVEVPVGAEIAYKGAGAYTALPIATYDLAARTAGSSTNVMSVTGVAFAPGHVYTVSARGDITVVSTTAATRPILTFSFDR